ncbi:DNA repair protein RecO [Xanthobacter sp. TB0139]|uniref:DNA repair protein RecO n=1 Tax=Xanthobacter sp. TB0139 TaxID=3459178 RepID=UPI00403A7453
MEWSDEGIVIGVRRHGESSAIVELLTRRRGRHLGMVRGGGSRRLAPLLQPGNTVNAVWRARLEEHMGNYTLEPLLLRVEMLMIQPHATYGITHMSQLLRLLPERDPQSRLYATYTAILNAFGDVRAAGILLARFELALLRELGFGLELERCAATGQCEDLIYVSPRSGRAVSRAAGAPYAERLFGLPPFLVHASSPCSELDVEEAFRLTGFFLQNRVLEPRGLHFSEARSGFIAAWRRANAVETSCNSVASTLAS